MMYEGLYIYDNWNYFLKEIKESYPDFDPPGDDIIEASKSKYILFLVSLDYGRELNYNWCYTNNFEKCKECGHCSMKEDSSRLPRFIKNLREEKLKRILG